MPSMLEEDRMNTFVTDVVMAGVLCFAGGIVAWLANRARIMGAPPLWPRIALGGAVALLAGAVWLVVAGGRALPSAPPAEPPRAGPPEVSDFIR
jgi:hypothetical protein